jgi:alpha-methylacyl-CoA racemase
MGPLSGYRIVEFAGLGPAPFAGMMLSDMGAEVLRVERANAPVMQDPKLNIMNRGRKSVAIDLKNPEGVDIAQELIKKADCLIEGYRPGVMERLGLGPDICLEVNPKLVYGRMTGWGQDGPLANAAGHDINYIALTGALHAFGHKNDKPVPPLNLVGDFGGGAMFLSFGIVCALLEASKSGQGQIVDAAMVDGIASLTSMFHGLIANGLWQDKPASNSLDSAAHFYDTYECADGKFVAIGAIEPKFYELLVEKIGLANDPQMHNQHDPSEWPELSNKFAAVFRTKSRAEWCKILEGTDACFAPVLSFGEAIEHPHMKSRGNFITQGNLTQPAPAPRFSRTPGSIQSPPSEPGSHSKEALKRWGIEKSKIENLIQNKIVLQHKNVG